MCPLIRLKLFRPLLTTIAALWNPFIQEIRISFLICRQNSIQDGLTIEAVRQIIKEENAKVKP
jgi:hypothetical protein